jgi:hypothetical protein
MITLVSMRGQVPPRFAGLSSDDKGAVPRNSAQSWDAEMAEWRNASEFYELDTGKNYRYDAENEVWCEYSNGGGGGGMINGITGNDGTVAVSTNVVSGIADLSVRVGSGDTEAAIVATNGGGGGATDYNGLSGTHSWVVTLRYTKS